MSDYVKIAKGLRKEVSQITLSQQKQLAEIYSRSINNITSQIRTDKAGSLKSKWQKDMVKSLKAERARLVEEIEASIKSGISDAAKVSTRSQFKLLEDIAGEADMKVSKQFADMYTSVNTNVVNDILLGNLYKDSKTLSSRIWDYGAGFENDVQSVISQGILQKKSAKDLAKDLEKFVKDPSKRGKAWGDDYPSLKGKKVEYNAMRLARTSINHSYQTATIQSSQINPFVLGIEWSSALIHGRTCELCRERDGTIFPKDDVPLDHPNGLCAMIPAITKSTEEVGQELLDWLNGGKNSALDDAFDRVRAQEGILAPSAKL